jgi:hypothetical protein
MFEVTDETDKFTGERQIHALLQPQERGAPMVQLIATIAGHQFPKFAGTGSYHFMIEWENAKEIDGLIGALGLAPEASTMEFNLFYCLIDGRPVQFEDTFISKRTGLTDDGNETLVFIVSVTVETLKQISAAAQVECKIDSHEFILNEAVREKIGKLLPLIGGAKTATQLIIGQHAQAESTLQSIAWVGVILGLVGLSTIVFIIIKLFG